VAKKEKGLNSENSTTTMEVEPLCGENLGGCVNQTGSEMTNAGNRSIKIIEALSETRSKCPVKQKLTLTNPVGACAMKTMRRAQSVANQRGKRGERGKSSAKGIERKCKLKRQERWQQGCWRTP